MTYGEDDCRYASLIHLGRREAAIIFSVRHQPLIKEEQNLSNLLFIGSGTTRRAARGPDAMPPSAVTAEAVAAAAVAADAAAAVRDASAAAHDELDTVAEEPAAV